MGPPRARQGLLLNTSTVCPQASGIVGFPIAQIDPEVAALTDNHHFVS